uniref:Uncharacterized protein n=1 Tax=Ditylenchus dipsaci TaxID=166011 RepID=A0A915CS42_9BILA
MIFSTAENDAIYKYSSNNTDWAQFKLQNPWAANVSEETLRKQVMIFSTAQDDAIYEYGSENTDWTRFKLQNPWAANVSEETLRKR